MDPKDEKILLLLEAIDKKECRSQRELSKKLKMSLGLVNTFIKSLTSQGVFKVVSLPKNKVQYILTTKGMIEKGRLSMQYLSNSIRHYNEAKRRVSDTLTMFDDERFSRLIFYGATEICEIACILLNENSVKDVKIIDKEKVGNKICGRQIYDESILSNTIYDAVIIMESENYLENHNMLLKQGIPSDMIFSIFR